MHTKCAIYLHIRIFTNAAALLKDTGIRVEHFNHVNNTVQRVTLLTIRNPFKFSVGNQADSAFKYIYVFSRFITRHSWIYHGFSAEVLFHGDEHETSSGTSCVWDGHWNWSSRVANQGKTATWCWLWVLPVTGIIPLTSFKY